MNGAVDRIVVSTGSVPSVGRSGWIVAQLALAIAAALLLRAVSPELATVMVACGVAFLLQAHAPAAWRDRLLLAASLVGGALIVARAQVVTGHFTRALLTASLFVVLLAALALLFLWVLRWKCAAKWRAAALLAIAAALAVARSQGELLAEPQWQLVGALFMFRLLVYAYDVLSGKRQERWIDGLNYLFLLPAFHFLLFPVVDYATFKRSRAADPWACAQRGIAWITRGLLQLAVYRLLYHRIAVSPDEVDSPWMLLRYVLPAYLMYTNVSGQFHLIVGLLHLQGWQLPETNRQWLLADSFTDFWRRINLYWKEFMVRVFWYPAWFRLRKSGERRATIVATILVFVATTLLHSWQTFWLRGDFALTAQDLVFWGFLGTAVLIGVLREQAGPKAAPRPTGWRRGLAIARVALTMTLLWSMWSSASLGDWFATLAWWNRA